MKVCKSCGGEFTSNYQMSNKSAWHKQNSTIYLEQRYHECVKLINIRKLITFLNNYFL